MTTKNSQYSDNNQKQDEMKYAFYCDFLEKEYKNQKKRVYLKY